MWESAFCIGWVDEKNENFGWIYSCWILVLSLVTSLPPEQLDIVITGLPFI